MYFIIKKILIFLPILLILNCSISSKLYVEQKIEENNKNIISQISDNNSDIKDEISEMKVKLDSMQYYYDQNSLYISNLTNRYHLLKSEISGYEAKSSLYISSVFKKINSLDKKIQQFVLLNDKVLTNSTEIPDSQFKQISNIEIQDLNNNIDSLNFRYYKIQNEYNMLVKDLTLIERSMIDIVRYSTNRLKNEVEKENELLKNDIEKIYSKQDSINILINGVKKDVKILNSNNIFINRETDSLFVKDTLE